MIVIDFVVLTLVSYAATSLGGLALIAGGSYLGSTRG